MFPLVVVRKAVHVERTPHMNTFGSLQSTSILETLIQQRIHQGQVRTSLGRRTSLFNKLFKAERDNLEFSEGLYAWVGADVEDRILRKYGKIPAGK